MVTDQSNNEIKLYKDVEATNQDGNQEYACSHSALKTDNRDGGSSNFDELQLIDEFLASHSGKLSVNFEYQSEKIKIIPNPANDQIKIYLESGSSDYENGTFKILDAHGRIVQYAGFSDLNGRSFSIASLPSGVYFLILLSSNNKSQNALIFIKK